MFDDDKPRKMVSSRSDNVVAAGIYLDKLDPDELISLYDELRERMRRLGVALTLADMNIEEELLLQFQTVRRLQSEVIDDEAVAVNQRAQVANAVSASLTKIADLQNSVWGSERAKRVELMLIRQLTKLPEETAAGFLDDFEKAFGSVADK